MVSILVDKVSLFLKAQFWLYTVFLTEDSIAIVILLDLFSILQHAWS